MRVVRVAERLPPLPGGKEIHVLELTRHQLGRGDDVVVFYRLGDPADKAECRRVSLGRIHDLLPGASKSMVFGFLVALRVLFMLRRPDVLHVHGDYAELLGIGPACRLRRIKLVVTVHGGLNLRYARIATWTFKRADAFIALGDTPADQLRSLGVAEGSLRQMHSGVNESMLTHQAATTRRNQEFNIVTVGLLDKVKNHETVIRAFQRLDGADKSLRLHIVGDGPERTRLQTLAQGDPRVVFHGQQSRENVYSIIHEASIFVLASMPTTSKAEGLPTALLEAMYLGRVCVISDSIATTSSLDPRAYLRFPGNQVSELARVIAWVIDNPGEAAIIAEAAEDASREFGWSVVGEQMRTVLREVATRG